MCGMRDTTNITLPEQCSLRDLLGSAGSCRILPRSGNFYSTWIKKFRQMCCKCLSRETPFKLLCMLAVLRIRQRFWRRSGSDFLFCFPFGSGSYAFLPYHTKLKVEMTCIFCSRITSDFHSYTLATAETELSYEIFSVTLFLSSACLQSRDLVELSNFRWCHRTSPSF